MLMAFPEEAGGSKMALREDRKEEVGYFGLELERDIMGEDIQGEMEIRNAGYRFVGIRLP